MEFCRMTSPHSTWFPQAMELYALSFPLHEQRTLENQASAMKNPAFHCDVLVENGAFAGLLFSWEGPDAAYVEHFATAPALRGGGTGARALRAFCETRPSVVLEIDPPTDELSIRRRAFYRRMGFVENSFDHRHPAYRAGFAPHPLVVMTWPRPFREEEYRRFYGHLCGTVMGC